MKRTEKSYKVGDLVGHPTLDLLDIILETDHLHNKLLILSHDMGPQVFAVNYDLYVCDEDLIFRVK